jgi:CRP/FNR family transcriptional regulator
LWLVAATIDDQLLNSVSECVMFETCEIAEKRPETPSGAEPCGQARRSRGTCSRLVARGEALFRAGQVRDTLYRVKQGALCHYMTWPDGTHEVIEFAFPGDIVGFGHIEHHVSTATAMVDVLVEILASNALDMPELRRDPLLASRLSAMADREFDLVKARAMRQPDQPAAARVAAVLAVLTHMSTGAGTAATAVEDSALEHICEHNLELAQGQLRAALRELQGAGLVRLLKGSVEVLDLPGLEKIRDAA